MIIWGGGSFLRKRNNEKCGHTLSVPEVLFQFPSGLSLGPVNSHTAFLPASSLPDEQLLISLSHCNLPLTSFLEALRFLH